MKRKLVSDHIAREGETEFASIHRNRSGQDAGCIDFGLRVVLVEKLSEADKRDIIRTARALLRSITNATGLPPQPIDNDCISCSGDGCNCEKFTNY